MALASLVALGGSACASAGDDAMSGSDSLSADPAASASRRGWPTTGGTASARGAYCKQPERASDVSVGADYRSSYAIFRLDAVPGLAPQKFGGMTLKAGDPNTLILAAYGEAGDVGALYAVGLARTCGHVTGFSGPAVRVAATPDVDGSPTNLSNDHLLAIVPAGFPGAGSVKLVSFDTGEYFEAALTVDASGLPSATPVKRKLVLPGGPHGLAYVPHGSPRFFGDSMIVSEWGESGVATYRIDASGDPILSTRRPFLAGVTGAEGAFFDPATGDFLLSTWDESGGVDQLYAVQGFVAL
jgi:hypothetical protein